MTNLEQKLANLSPEKRKLLLQKLKKQKNGHKTFPVSFAQRRLWFLDQFEPNSPYYNIPIALKLSGPFNFDMFKKAIQSIIDRHESLRTTFVDKKGEPFQVIASLLNFNISKIDISSKTEQNVERLYKQFALEEAREPFDLAKGPLIRVSVIKGSERDHLVLLTMHHIISDGWSIGVLVTEITRMYDALLKGKPSPLAKLAIQYPDYAVWQQKYLQGEVFKKQLEFWKNQFQVLPPVLELPTDRPRPTVQTNVGSSITRKFSAELTEELNTLSRKNNATLFMTLIAACQVLLSRLSGQHDISVGTPIANRTRGELESLIGLFINTIVIYNHLDGNPSFEEFLNQVRQSTLAAYEHQDLPFEYLVDALQPDRDMSVSPLFQVMFILQNAPSDIQHISDLTMEMLPVDLGTSTFDLTFSVTESPLGLNVSLEYNTDLFDRATVERFLFYYQTLLESITKNANVPIFEIPILPPSDLQLLTKEWNANPVEYRGNKFIHQLIEEQVQKNPEAIALIAGEERISYGQLNERANHLAHYLIQQGARPETRIGLSLERSINMVIGLLGILKSGAAYVPLDPNYPQERLEYIIRDSSISFLVTQENLKHIFRQTSCPVICLDSQWSTIENEQLSTNPQIHLATDNIAYIIYTSGSTGLPKGVLISHRSVVNHNLAVKNLFKLQSHDRVLQFATINFDAAVEEIFPTLQCGATLVLRNRDILISGRELLQLIRKETLTIVDLPTAYWQQWINDLNEMKAEIPKALRLVILGGDKVAPEYVYRWNRMGGQNIRLLNTYGPTETTIISTAYEMEDPVAESGLMQEMPIGRPIANTSTYILNKNLQPAPIGVPGELYIGGEGLARGYLNQASFTAENFIPDPFAQEPGRRIYKTGDLVKYRNDGNIEFLGRVDFQVKIRGFRVEPGEVENSLVKIKNVKDAVVLARNDDKLGTQLVAYIVPAAEALESSEIREILARQLPDYMVPAAYVPLEALPLTPNGKVDRKALPDPDQDQLKQDFEKTYQAPANPIEESLVQIWMELLGLDKVGVLDNFFDRGGHSLIATQLTSRIRDTFEVEIPLRDLFQHPTIQELALAIEQMQMGPKAAQAPPIVPAPRAGDLPLSYAQQRLWFLDQLEPESPFYNIPDIFRLTGPLNQELLEQALNQIVIRHEILRTTIHTKDGKGVQRILPQLNIEIPLIDMSHLNEDVRDQETLAIIQENAQKSFRLDRAPLFRMELYKLDMNEHVVLFVIHHIISDNWSAQVLIQELVAIYDALAEDRSQPLPNLPFQYVDFAVWQRKWLEGAVLESQLNYWKEHLAQAPPVLELPTDRPRPAKQTFNGSYQTFKHSLETSKALNELAMAEGATLFMVLLAAFQVFLYRYSGQDRISVGTPVAGRNRSDLERLIGFFVNTLVMHSDLSGQPSFREVLSRVKSVALGAYAHQDIPFEKLVDAIQPERDMSHSPLFQAMFTLQNIPGEIQSHSQLSLTPVDVQSGTAKFDLTLFVQEHPTHLSAALEYNTDLFEQPTIDRMIGHFKRLVNGLVSQPDLPINQVEMMVSEERDLVLNKWNGQAIQQKIDQPIQNILEDQASRMPDQPALIFGTQVLSYAELNQSSNRLANYLISLNIQPDDLIGLQIRRSIDMIIAIFGILKAGAAYVPVDPAYPTERKTYILEDSNVKLLISQESLLDQLPDTDIPVFCMDRDREIMAAQAVENPAVEIDADQLAYMIYTSGSTGKPKGTLITHRGLINYLDWCSSAYPINEGRGSLLHSTIAFDATVSALFTPILAGKSITLIPESQDLEALSQALIQYKDFSLIKITPAHLNMLSSQIPKEVADQLTKAFVIGGENLTADQIDFWQKNAGSTKLFNEYGPTETVVGCVVFEALSWKGKGSVPIGTAIGNTKVYILDESLAPVPAGIAGELYIGGEGLARGYHNRPDLTAERFIPNPFSDQAGARLYKTGDLVRYLQDGKMEFLDRLDSQVKIRGYRIELNEIESALQDVTDLQDAVVSAVRGSNNLNRLVAYCIPRDGKTVSTTELRAVLQKSLPDYMVPAQFVELAEFPLTPNGKIDYKALPQPDDSRPALETEFVAASSERERLLSEIWSHLLNVKQVGINDNFFELGGDSIIGIQMISQARQQGLQITPVQIFQHQTIAQLAAVASTAPIIEAEQGLVSGEVALTPVQHWFFDQKLSNRNHWNQSLILQVNNPLDMEILRKTISVILDHHDALRLQFSEKEGAVIQTNSHKVKNETLILFDISNKTEQEQKAFILEQSTEIQASLDIESGPIFKVAYFNAGQKPGRILIVAHHLAIDGVSWRIILEDFQAAYSMLKSGQEAQLPQKTTSFKEWASAITTYSRSLVDTDEKFYWQTQSQLETIQLRTDYQNGKNSEGSVREVSVSLTEEETNALLTEVPPVYNTKINDILAAALLMGFEKWNGKRRISFSMEGHGREHISETIDVSRTVGWFTSIFPVHLDLGKAVQPKEIILSIKEQLSRIPNNGLGFGLLRYLSADEPLMAELSRMDQQPISFNYLGQFDQGIPPDSVFSAAHESKGPERDPSGLRSSQIDITGAISGWKLSMSFSYSTNLFQPGSIEKFAESFINALRAIIKHCQNPEAGGRSASDFELAQLNDKKLDKVMAQLGKKKKRKK